MLRHPEGYFLLITDWIAGQELQATYGSAVLEPATVGQPINAAALDGHAQPLTE